MEWGSRNAEYGMGKWECGSGNAEVGMGKVDVVEGEQIFHW